MAATLRKSNARFVLDHSAKKVACPSCGKNGTFRLYVDTRTGENLPDHVGLCDRENNCGYNYGAAQWVRDGGAVVDVQELRRVPVPPPVRNDWRCPQNIVDMTFGLTPGGSHFATRNNLIDWMLSTHLDDEPLYAFQEYNVGTYPAGRRWPQLEGAAVFWQMGQDLKPRSGKVIQYDRFTGKRDKVTKANWMHSIATGKRMDELGCAQCLFGEHLLYKYPDRPVAIVESEKTALICSCVYPSHVWLASGGLHGLDVSKCMALSGRDVTFFPDQGVLAEWTERAMDLEPMLASCVVSDIMECIGAADGEDLADYIVPVNVLAAMGVDVFPAPRPKEPDPAPEQEEKLAQLAMAQIKEQEKVGTPVSRILDMPGVAALVKEMDIDTSRITIKPINK